MAQPPQTLTLKTNRDRDEWWQASWVRRVLLLVPGLLVVLALTNAFGQRMVSDRATSAQATLTVTAPTHARSGIIYAARFTVDAVTEVKKATLVLDSGWPTATPSTGKRRSR